MQIRITGGRDLTNVRRALAIVGDKGLGKQLGDGLKAATAPLGRDIRAETKILPAGYAPILSKSLRFRTAQKVRKQQAQVEFRVHGDGQRERRDVPRINAGTLRHPVYGRTRPLKRHAVHKATSMKNPWVAQKVPAGFVDRPVDRLGPQVRKQMDAVIDHVADQITKG